MASTWLNISQLLSYIAIQLVTDYQINNLTIDLANYIQILTKGMIVNNQLQLYSFCYFIVCTNARIFFLVSTIPSTIPVVCVMMAIQQKHQVPFTFVYQLCSYLYVCLFLLKQLITFSLYSLARMSFAASHLLLLQKRSLWPLIFLLFTCKQQLLKLI